MKRIMQELYIERKLYISKISQNLNFPLMLLKTLSAFLCNRYYQLFTFMKLKLIPIKLLLLSFSLVLLIQIIVKQTSNSVALGVISAFSLL